MCHKQDIARDIAAACHDILTDDWFYSWSDEVIADTVGRLSPGQLKSTVTVAKAILKANAFTQWDAPGSLGYRTLFNDLCEVVDPLLNDYASFCERQFELTGLVRVKTKQRAQKVLPTTPEQRRALDSYFATLVRNHVMTRRDFPPNVVDLVAMRAQREQGRFR